MKKIFSRAEAARMRGRMISQKQHAFRQKFRRNPKPYCEHLAARRLPISISVLKAQCGGGIELLCTKEPIAEILKTPKLRILVVKTTMTTTMRSLFEASNEGIDRT